MEWLKVRYNKNSKFSKITNERNWWRCKSCKRQEVRKMTVKCAPKKHIVCIYIMHFCKLEIVTFNP